MIDCLIGVGSNLGDRRSILDAAVAELKAHAGPVVASKWLTYPAIGGPDQQDDFLNGAIRLQTMLNASDLTQLLMQIEKDAGRERHQRWSSRTLDCDLLLYGDRHIDTPTLQVPHPRMFTRRFVLEPAIEVASEMVHPIIGWSIEKLFQHLVSAPPYFAVIGSQNEERERIAMAMSEAVGAQMMKAPKGWGDFDGLSESMLSEQLASLKTNLQAADLPTRALVSTFWIGEPYLGSQRTPKMAVSDLQPKLLVVTDAADSEFASLLHKLDASLRLPTLFLSGDPQHAVQDAVGAVAAMR